MGRFKSKGKEKEVRKGRKEGRGKSGGNEREGKEKKKEGDV